MIRPLVFSPACQAELPHLHLIPNVWNVVLQVAAFRCCPVFTRRERTAGALTRSYLDRTELALT